MARVFAYRTHTFTYQPNPPRGPLIEMVIPAGDEREVPDADAQRVVSAHPTKLLILDAHETPPTRSMDGTYNHRMMESARPVRHATTCAAMVRRSGKVCGREVPCKYHEQDNTDG